MSGSDWSAAGKDLPPEEAAPADLARAVERLNELAKSSKRSLQFSVDEASGRTVITVYNAATQEIVRQIPSEEVLAAARSLDAIGVLLRTKA